MPQAGPPRRSSPPRPRTRTARGCRVVRRRRRRRGRHRSRAAAARAARRRRNRVRAPRAVVRRGSSRGCGCGIRRSSVARAPDDLPSRRTHRDDRHGPRPGAVLARPPHRTAAGAAGGPAARQRAAPSRASPERPPVRRRRAVVRGLRARPRHRGNMAGHRRHPARRGTLDGDTAAEIATSRDGEFVYAGVRGSNTLATLRVSGQGGPSARRPRRGGRGLAASPRRRARHAARRRTAVGRGGLADPRSAHRRARPGAPPHRLRRRRPACCRRASGPAR